MADHSQSLFPEQPQQRKKQTAQTAASIFLVILMLYLIAQFLAVYQTIYQLTSPIIPKDLIWEINKQFVFKGFIASVISLIGLVLYFFKKYTLIIVLVILTLILSRFILIKPGSDFEVTLF